MFVRNILIALNLIFLTACGGDDPSFSILPESNNFQSTSSFNNKIDILWVVDNSGSMAPYQQNVADNFSAFIQDFQTKGYDFRIAVITTEAWTENFWGGSTASFRSNAGSAILTPDTPNLETAFLQNILQGTAGYGDERAFQSIEFALTDPSNSGYNFPRSDAFLAVIIVSDEDDFSHAGSAYANRNYSYPGLYSISHYTDFLDTLTGSTPTNRSYNVSTISVLDAACQSDPNSHADAIIGQRYMDFVDATDGIKGSICDANFSSSLNSIQSKISELSTQFYLTREPVPGSIRVKINGSDIPESAVNGWTYNATSNSIKFHGAATPAEGDSISVTYDPTSLDI